MTHDIWLALWSRVFSELRLALGDRVIQGAWLALDGRVIPLERLILYRWMALGLWLAPAVWATLT